MTTRSQLKERWKVEPGISIHKRISEFLRPFVVEGGRDSAPLFDILDGLPYREEVPNGRDFRGTDFMRGWELALEHSDFSFSKPLRDFRKCNLAGSKFDESRGESNNFHDSDLKSTSFRQVRLKKPHFTRCDARNACFDDAWLFQARFDDADLRDASFRNADLKGSCLAGSKVQGCDFRGANLEECSLSGLEVDENTDFRGANLTNAFLEAHYDKRGNLIGRALDLTTAKTDASTRLAKDPKAMSIELLKAALDVSHDHRELEALRARQAIQLVLDDLIRKDFFPDWPERLRAGLSQAEIDMLEEMLDDASREV